MPCSFCKFAGHNVTTCQSTVLLNTFNDAVNKAVYLKTKPNTTSSYTSNADIFKHHISNMDMSTLKGIAGKLGISVSKKNANTLVALITCKMYFNDTMPDNGMINDLIYYLFLKNIIENSTFNALTTFIERMRDFEDLIKRQIRIYNIALLRNASHFYERLVNENQRELYNVLFLIRNDTNGLQKWFGSFITLEDIIEHIPSLQPYLTRDHEDNLLDQLIESLYNDNEEAEIFEDVILPQSLDLTCEYVKKEISREHAVPDGKTTSQEEECIICYSGATCDTVLNCGHTYCIDCVITTVKMTMVDHRKKLSCPMCRADMKHVKSSNEEEVYNLAYLLR